MKKIIVLACMMISATVSFAQFNDSKHLNFKHSVNAGYEWMHMANDNGGLERNFNMLNIGYNTFMSPLASRPEFRVGTGLAFAIGTSKNVQYNVVNKPLNVDYTISYLKLPILAAYELKINENMSILPTAGFYLKEYLKATSSSYSNDKDVQAAYQYFGMSFGKTDEFHQKTEKYNWKHFGCGIQAGANIVVKEHFLVGVNYLYELTKIDPVFGYNFTHNVNVKLGYIF